jgi:tetratricopeptide (TPR) repeat protein
MKKIIYLVVMCVALVVMGEAIARASSPAALLLSCAGDVSVVRNDGSTVKGSYGLPLNPGDEVRTAAGAEAEIHFENGTWIKVGSGSSLEIKATSMKKLAAEPAVKENSFESVQNFLKLRDSEGVSSLAALRSGGKVPEIRLEAPCQTRVRNGWPEFRWSASDSAAELRLKVYDASGVRWQRDVKGTTALRYPVDASPLVPGTTYSWTIETTDPLRFPPLRTQAAFFEVISGDEEKALEGSIASIDRASLPSESAYRVVLASIFFDHQLYDEAIGETTRALAVDPDNASLRAILARLYAETGRTEEAMGEYDKLLEKR